MTLAEQLRLEARRRANRAWELRDASASRVRPSRMGPLVSLLGKTAREKYFDALLLVCTERACQAWLASGRAI